MKLTIPIRTGRGLNDRLHWAAKARQTEKQRAAVHALWPWRWRHGDGHCDDGYAFSAHLVRISPATRPLDDDNLRGALKAVRDQVAEELGVDDGDTTRVRWKYGQRRGPWGVVVEVLFLDAGLPF